jgi:hypothetical protein
MIRFLVLIALLTPLVGCASRQTVRYDEFDRAEIAEIRGNYVSGRLFGKTVLALNPRREARQITLVTNTVVEFKTNLVTTTLTNLIITLATNSVIGSSTNDNPPIPVVAAAAKEEEAASGETNAAPAQTAQTNVVVVTPPQPLTNITTTTGLNLSALRGPNQTGETAQRVQGLTRSVSLVTNNQTITVQLNEVVTFETNRTLTVQTNQFIVGATNVTILKTNLVVHDYYLCTELISPVEFAVAPGENLTLVIDNDRYVLSQTNTPAALAGRKRFTTALYRVPEDVFARIADAKQVRIRLKGTLSVIERTLPKSTQKKFKEFVTELERLAKKEPAREERG